MKKFQIWLLLFLYVFVCLSSKSHKNKNKKKDDHPIDNITIDQLEELINEVKGVNDVQNNSQKTEVTEESTLPDTVSTGVELKEVNDINLGKNAESMVDTFGITETDNEKEEEEDFTEEQLSNFWKILSETIKMRKPVSLPYESKMNIKEKIGTDTNTKFLEGYWKNDNDEVIEIKDMKCTFIHFGGSYDITVNSDDKYILQTELCVYTADPPHTPDSMVWSMVESVLNIQKTSKWQRLTETDDLSFLKKKSKKAIQSLKKNIKIQAEEIKFDEEIKQAELQKANKETPVDVSDAAIAEQAKSIFADWTRSIYKDILQCRTKTNLNIEEIESAVLELLMKKMEEYKVVLQKYDKETAQLKAFDFEVEELRENIKQNAEDELLKLHADVAAKMKPFFRKWEDLLLEYEKNINGLFKNKSARLLEFFKEIKPLIKLIESPRYHEAVQKTKEWCAEIDLYWGKWDELKERSYAQTIEKSLIYQKIDFLKDKMTKQKKNMTKQSEEMTKLYEKMDKSFK